MLGWDVVGEDKPTHPCTLQDLCRWTVASARPERTADASGDVYVSRISFPRPELTPWYAAHLKHEAGTEFPVLTCGERAIGSCDCDSMAEVILIWPRKVSFRLPIFDAVVVAGCNVDFIRSYGGNLGPISEWVSRQ